MNRRLTFIVFAMITSFGALAWVGCGSPRRADPFTPAPALATPEQRHGQIVFMNHCHQCHPGGAAGLAPAINDKPLPAFLIKMQVRNGLGAMPAFGAGQIPDDDLDGIVAYLKALRATRGNTDVTTEDTEKYTER
ncbi:MAG: c-type cytochrome [Tepidisphaeraceae bacterium]